LDQLDNCHAENKRSGNNSQFEINQDTIGTTTVDAHDNNLVSQNPNQTSDSCIGYSNKNQEHT